MQNYSDAFQNPLVYKPMKNEPPEWPYLTQAALHLYLKTWWSTRSCYIPNVKALVIMVRDTIFYVFPYISLCLGPRGII